MIQIEMTGDDKVQAKFNASPDKIYDRLYATMTKLGLDLLGIVVNDKLSGQVLKRQTGRLAGAQTMNMSADGQNITTQVGFNKSAAPEGEWHEFGVAKFWLIEAKRAKALRFEWHGEIVFKKRVMHPPLPERSFLRSALKDIYPRVKPELTAAVSEGLA